MHQTKIYIGIFIFIFIFICIILFCVHITTIAKSSSSIKPYIISNPVIPKTIYLCYKNKNIPQNIIPTWSKLNPGYKIHLYDNNDCKNFLYEEYGTEFVEIFSYIKDGPIKADFWRVCILYKYGGTYADIDIEPLYGINDIIENNVGFMTCISRDLNKYNPHLIICTPSHPILASCIEIYRTLYRESIPYEYWTYSIVTIMGKVLNTMIGTNINTDGVYKDSNNNLYQFAKEIDKDRILQNIYCEYKTKRILNNRIANYDPINHQFIV